MFGIKDKDLKKLDKEVKEDTKEYLKFNSATKQMSCLRCGEIDFVKSSNIFKQVKEMKAFHKKHKECKEVKKNGKV